MTAATIDHLLREAGGFALGPFELMDLIGFEQADLALTEVLTSLGDLALAG